MCTHRMRVTASAYRACYCEHCLTDPLKIWWKPCIDHHNVYGLFNLPVLKTRTHVLTVRMHAFANRLTDILQTWWEH
jgi:hypothetical protein